MKHPAPWIAEEERPILDCRIFQVEQLVARRHPAEGQRTFYRIDSADWTNVIPVTEDGDVVLIRQFRHGMGAEILEIPGGIVEPGEAPQDCAARELFEETGYRAETMTPIGSVNPNPALFRHRLHCFLAEGCRKVSEVSNPGDEETVVQVVALDDIPELIRSGAIDHALVLAAFHWFRLRQWE